MLFNEQILFFIVRKRYANESVGALPVFLPMESQSMSRMKMTSTQNGGLSQGFGVQAW